MSVTPFVRTIHSSIIYGYRILLRRRLHSHGILARMVTLLRVRDVAERKGITTAYQLQKAAQLHPGHAAKLWKGDVEMIGLKTINTLCEALGCEPGDLLVRVQNGKPSDRKKRRG